MSVIVHHQELIAHAGRGKNKIVSIAPISVTRGAAGLIMIPVGVLSPKPVAKCCLIYFYLFIYLLSKIRIFPAFTSFPSTVKV